MNQGILISLCDYTGNMVRPWADAGYECLIVDIKHPPGPRQQGKVTTIGADVRRWIPPNRPIAFVAAFPPCTHLAVSGARWFKVKGLDALADALRVVAACERIALASQAPYLIENPVSTLSTYWRPPDHRFDPCDYAGYLDDPSQEAYTKRTCLWTGNGFTMPATKPIDAVQGSKIHMMPDSKGRAERRSITPLGFAQAVFLANHT